MRVVATVGAVKAYVSRCASLWSDAERSVIVKVGGLRLETRSSKGKTRKGETRARLYMGVCHVKSEATKFAAFAYS